MARRYGSRALLWGAVVDWLVGAPCEARPGRSFGKAITASALLPCITHYAGQVQAEDLVDARAAVTAGLQPFGEMLEPVGPVEFRNQVQDFGILSWRNHAFASAALDELAVPCAIGRNQRCRRNESVGADGYMILSADRDGMLDVADQVLASRLSRISQEWHEVDTEDSALVGQLPHMTVVGVARPVDQVATGAMRYQARTFAVCDGLRDRAGRGTGPARRTDP